MEPYIERVNTLTDNGTLLPRIIDRIECSKRLAATTGQTLKGSLFDLVCPGSHSNYSTLVSETWPGPVTCGRESELGTDILEIFGVSIVNRTFLALRIALLVDTSVLKHPVLRINRILATSSYIREGSGEHICPGSIRLRV